MEKITLQKFREIKDEIIALLNKPQTAFDKGEELSEEERESYEARYKEIVKELLNYDLSEIDFKEWAGMALFSTSDCPMDFSKTKANLDCSIIEYWFEPQYTNLKGCKIKNFNFGANEFLTQMFDDDFIRENYNEFLSEKIFMLIKQKEIRIPIEELRRYSEIYGIDSLYVLIGNDKTATIDFIKKYGFDNIIALNNETSGMFSHNLWRREITLDMFAELDKSTPNSNGKNEISYEEFRNRMYELLIKGRDVRGLLRTGKYPNYDFIGGKFREEHQDIFIDDKLPDIIKTKFYTGTFNTEDIKNNPELIEILKDKNIETLFSMDMLVIHREEKKDELTSPIPVRESMVSFLTRLIGNREFLKLCRDYGKCLQSMTIVINNENSVEEIRKLIDETLYKELHNKNKVLEYFEDLPQSFKNRYPELFLPNTINRELREKFYKGILGFEDIRHNPELAEILKHKDVEVGIRNRREQLELWEILEKNLSQTESIRLIGKYGEYLQDILPTLSNIGSGELYRRKRVSELLRRVSFTADEFEKIAIYEIERNIFSGVSPYTENVPEFFKNKYPEMFLEKDAPDELKKYFYSKRGEIRRNPESPIKADYEFSFSTISEHPEWIKYLRGKDFTISLNERYKKMLRLFDSETLLKLCFKNAETLDKMVSFHREGTLRNWFNATQGRFLPNYIVMLYFPEEKIDSFLKNSNKWSRLLQSSNFKLSDDGKAAMLKAAYVMGVFEGIDDGFQKTMELFSGIPKRISEEEYKQLVESVKYDDEQTRLISEAYVRKQDDTYVLTNVRQGKKGKTKQIRRIMEQAGIRRVLNKETAHQMFDSFKMEYNPDFAQFFYDNFEEIISNPDYISSISSIQRQFKDIIKTNAGRKITLEVAQDYIRSISYNNIEVGNEEVAEQAKIAGYDQETFMELQKIFNEGETREFSTIPRITGELDGYTYEILRGDDALALIVGKLTNCCQEIDGAASSSWKHSIISPEGRVFVVRDNDGKIVAQSWFWRNQYTGCFDNIEIPNRIMSSYEKEHPEEGKKGLTRRVLEVYKKASRELMVADEIRYRKMLEDGKITQEQYDELVFKRITIGLGYNDIADAIKGDDELVLDTRRVLPRTSDKLPYLYTDAGEQYVVTEVPTQTISTEFQAMPIFEDDIPIYDSSNMTRSVLYKIKRMEQSEGRNNLSDVGYSEDNADKAETIIGEIAGVYRLTPSRTRVLSTPRMAMIYSEGNGIVKIGDMYTAKASNELNEEEAEKYKKHILYQIKKAIKQIGYGRVTLDYSNLKSEQKDMIQSAIEEIELERKRKEKDR